MSRKARLLACLGFSVSTLMSVSAVSAQVYDAASDFSLASNPNGVWQYGITSTNSLDSPFILDTFQETYGPVEFWGVANTVYLGGPPFVSHNTSNMEIEYGSVRWQPGQILMHPGQNGEYSVLRWTAPSAGTLFVQTSFIGQDVETTTTDVHVVHNDTSLFDGNVNGYLNSTSFTGTIQVAANDTLDIAVGYGNGQFHNDSTGVRAHFTLVPAPSAWMTALLGAVPGVSVLLRRRYRQS